MFLVEPPPDDPPDEPPLVPPEVPPIVGAAPPISGAGFAWAACSMSRRWTSSRRAASAAMRRWRSSSSCSSWRSRPRAASSFRVCASAASMRSFSGCASASSSAARATTSSGPPRAGRARLVVPRSCSSSTTCGCDRSRRSAPSSIPPIEPDKRIAASVSVSPSCSPARASRPGVAARLEVAAHERDALLVEGDVGLHRLELRLRLVPPSWPARAPQPAVRSRPRRLGLRPLRPDLAVRRGAEGCRRGDGRARRTSSSRRIVQVGGRHAVLHGGLVATALSCAGRAGHGPGSGLHRPSRTAAGTPICGARSPRRSVSIAHPFRSASS